MLSSVVTLILGSEDYSIKRTLKFRTRYRRRLIQRPVRRIVNLAWVTVLIRRRRHRVLRRRLGCLVRRWVLQGVVLRRRSHLRRALDGRNILINPLTRLLRLFFTIILRIILGYLRINWWLCRCFLEFEGATLRYILTSRTLRFHGLSFYVIVLIWVPGILISLIVSHWLPHEFIWLDLGVHVVEVDL